VDVEKSVLQKSDKQTLFEMAVWFDVAHTPHTLACCADLI